MHVLAVADTDSYLKWSLATLAGLPAGWSSRQVLLRNAVMPSPAQVDDARQAAGHPAGVEVLGLPLLLARLVRDRPDVLLLACTGPVVETLTRLPALRGPGRPVLLTGLPGISVPASPRAVLFRRACDLFLVHSRRERREFTRLAAELAPGLAVGLVRLPFLPPSDAPLPPPAGADAPLVFAAQAQVPRQRAEREAVLRALAAAAPAVVKLRARAGEQQTHRERHPYDLLWADLVARGEVPAEAVGFVTGAMAEVLAQSRGLVTVSSTAALEALALGRPVLVVDDFGISAELVNLVFDGSGCTGGLADLGAGGVRTPEPDWLLDNYFHPEEDSDGMVRLAALVSRRSAGPLPRPPAAAPTTAARLVRQHLRLLVSASARRRLGRLRRAALRRRTEPPVPRRRAP